MRVKDKIMLDVEGLMEYGPINIVIFGDSVSHGAFNGYMDYERVYWNQLRQMLNRYRDYVPINMINASIGGTTAAKSVCRLEKQVLIRYIEGKSYVEISEEMNRHVKSVDNALQRIKRKLQKFLDEK